MADRLRIGSGLLSAEIDPLGAELWSLKDADGRELMTDADPRWWTGHAPILFPIVGAVRGGVYRLDGCDYALPQHGFARRMPFETVAQDAGSIRLRIVDDESTRAAYPFAFTLDIEHKIEGATLTTTATVTNRDSRTMPFSLGFHPAFAWPLPYGGTAAEHRIRFAAPEPSPIRKVGSEPGLIATEKFDTPVMGDTLTPTHEMFAGDALIWDELTSRSLTWGVPGQPQLRIDFPDTPWLGLWQKPGAHYLCIEPWAGIADPVGFTGEIWDKPGIIALEPGQQQRFRLAVTLLA